MNILVIRLSSLGDVVLTGLLVKRLRTAYPDARIDFLTGSAYRELLMAMPGLDGRYDSRVALPGRYDIVVDLQNNLRSRILTARIGAERIFRFHRQRFNRFQRIHFPAKRLHLVSPPHVALQYLNVVKTLGVTDDGERTLLHPPQEWLNAAKNLMHDQGLPMSSLLIAPGGRHLTKVYPADKWVDFIQKAYSNGFRNIGIIGEKGDELTALRFRESLHGEFPISIFCGKTDLASLTGLIASAGILVCGDSGPMHIAAAVGTPVVAIFGPTVQEFGFAPFSEKARVVEVSELSCRPCHPHGPDKCPKGHFRCMLDIHPEEVLGNVRELTSPVLSDL